MDIRKIDAAALVHEIERAAESARGTVEFTAARLKAEVQAAADAMAALPAKVDALLVEAAAVFVAEVDVGSGRNSVDLNIAGYGRSLGEFIRAPGGAPDRFRNTPTARYRAIVALIPMPPRAG